MSSWFTIHRHQFPTVQIGDMLGFDVDVDSLIREIESDRKLNLLIDSRGGDSLAALKLYGALVGRVNLCTIRGNCWSSALTIACVADRIEAAADAMILAHSPSVAAYGPLPEILLAAERLKPATEQFERILQRRSKQPAEIVRQWLSTDTWFTASEALAAGLVDSIYEPRQAAPVAVTAGTSAAGPEDDGKAALLLEILRAIGPVKTADRPRLGRELSVWFGASVTQSYER